MPDGTFIVRLLPSSVFILMSAPKIACETEIGTAQYKSYSLRSKNLSFLTLKTTIKSPEAPPFTPASPNLARTMRFPSSTPAGIVIVTV